MARLNFSNRYLLMPAAIVVFLLALFMIYEDIKERTTNEFNNEQLILAKTASQGITSFFSDYLSDLFFLSEQDDVIDLNSEGKSLISAYQETHKNLLAAITRVDPKGVIIYTYPYVESVIGTDISYQAHVKQVIRIEKPVISDAFVSRQGYMAIAIHVPVFKENKYAGSLAILIPIDKLGLVYLGKIKTSVTTDVWLLSENGVEIYCTEKDHTGKTFTEVCKNDPSALKLLEKIKSDTSGTAKSVHGIITENGKTKSLENYIVFYRTLLGNTYWTILISFQKNDIYLALDKLRNRLGIAFSILFILSSYYFFSLAKVRNVLREEAKRKNAEKTLKESEEKFRKLFEDHTAVKLLVEPESGVIVDANLAASKFYGWNRNELKCLKIQQIGIINPGELKVNQEKTGYEKRNQVEVSHRLKSGIIRNVEVFSSRITTGERELIHLIIHDITDRKMAEDELIKSKEKAIESDRLKTAFLQNISHEIRTPMNAIMGFSSLLAENFNDKKRIEQFTEIINLRCSDLLEIIDDILDISKIESGQLTVNPDICNLSELFADLSAFFNEHKKRIGKGEVELNLSFLPETIENTIVTDKLKLKQIFMNLLSNAFKFTDNGKIEGGCKYDSKGNLIFFVSDTGIGIPSDKYESIFERFTQLKTVSDRVVSGNGLGLSIVKGLIDLLGGKIWVDSKINYGTTFYFSIPYKISYQHPKADSTTEQFNEVNFRGKTILLVEDDFHITTYIKTILSGTGINIINTEFGSKSVQIALNQKIDLVLMDIRLPDMNGYEAIKQIKKGKPDLPIIAQTAYAATEDKQTAMSCGCIDYISKPIKREHFLFILNKHLSKIK